MRWIRRFADGSPASNEEVAGEALRPIRDKVIIATKGSLHWEDGNTVPDASRAPIRESVESSLKRLGVDTIALYYHHQQDKSKKLDRFPKFYAPISKRGNGEEP